MRAYRPDPVEFLDRLSRLGELREQIVFRGWAPPQGARYAEPARPLPPAVSAMLAERGIEALYAHQAEGLDHVRAGDDVVVVTPTASGKTLIYNLPVLEGFLQDPERHALYLFPYKALCRDQLKTLHTMGRELGLDPCRLAAVYDGDTPDDQRRRLRAAPPAVLLTNPDMLHLGILPSHEKWAAFFSRLSMIVLDELHVYRGVFGSHVSHVLRRLLRIAELHGARPTVVACSATIANPRELFFRLTGREAVLIERSGAPEQGRHFVILNPDTSGLTLATRLFELCVGEGYKTIAFTKARKITELIHSWVVRRDPRLARRVAAYRAGFLPEERREIESRLFDGRLSGVISTSALEVGIDVGGLDCCILVGYPGTITATRQRGGRVGRGGNDPIVFLVAGEDALDQYFVRRPDLLLEGAPEAVRLSPENPYILKPHLHCAAAERSLAREELLRFGEQAPAAAAEMAAEGELLLAAEGDRYHASRRAPQRLVDIRSAGNSYTIHEPGGRLVGTVSGVRAFHECHPGAIYMHAGRTYRVEQLDIDARKAVAAPFQADYYTQAYGEKETTILELRERRRQGPRSVAQGRVEVVETITGFMRKRIFGGEIIDREDLSLPPLRFETEGIWFEIDPRIQRVIEARGFHFMGALHALEHAALAVLPLFSICDRFDVAGISIPSHPQLRCGAVFIYDNYPGGLGIAETMLHRPEELLARTLDLVASCDCETGCPSCIFSPRCGAGNRPLDKAGVILLLELLLERAPLEEPPEEPAPASPAQTSPAFAGGQHPVGPAFPAPASPAGHSRVPEPPGAPPQTPPPMPSPPPEQEPRPPAPPPSPPSATAPAIAPETPISPPTPRSPQPPSPATTPSAGRSPAASFAPPARSSPQPEPQPPHASRTPEPPTSPAPSTPTPGPAPDFPIDDELIPDIVVFDLETLRSAEDVGGWRNTHLMGMAVGVILEVRSGKMLTCFEDAVDRLIDRLLAADLVVGFNHRRFDYRVLSNYRHVDWKAIPSLDILEVVHRTLKHRLSLQHLAQETLGETKSADGLQSLQWVKEGRLDLVAEYCRRDVEVTYRLFAFGVRHGYLLYRNWSGERLRCPVNWGEYWTLPEQFGSEDPHTR
jgi:DEAD/DEAH box helicase domain-containing protein